MRGRARDGERRSGPGSGGDHAVGLLAGVHGTVATLLICSLLFADEIGVPLPFAPNELLLIFAGVLIATGALSPAEFVPVAAVTIYAGSFVGYTWARQLGAPAIERLAHRLHATKTYGRAVARLQHAGAVPFIIARLIPAVRTQATLAAGAAAIDRRMFLTSNAIAVAIWLGVLTTVGWLIGVPASTSSARHSRSCSRAQCCWCSRSPRGRSAGVRRRSAGRSLRRCSACRCRFASRWLRRSTSD